MSLDFDSAALQVHEEDEEYDQEDYAREQELQQLLTGLPHDMLEDSGDHLSDYSAPEDNEHRDHERWDQAARWDDHPVPTNPQSDYGEHFLYGQGDLLEERRPSGWPDRHGECEEKSMFELSGGVSDDGSEGVYVGGGGGQQPNVYHLPEGFGLYANGHQQDFGNQHSAGANAAETGTEHLKLQFGVSETTNNQLVEPYKVMYKPYQNNIHQPTAVSSDAGRNKEFEEMQQEFLATGESSSENMQILQLQVLNKAKGRKLEELNMQLEEKAQQVRYLSHQLAIVKDEKDGVCLSLQESQKLYQNGKEKEIQLEGQIKVLEAQVQTLAANEEQLLKQSQVSEAALESLRQQLWELRQSDALQRAREQHEGVVAALRQKHDDQASALQQKLDATHCALQEQTELCCRLSGQVKQLERALEESKVEKNEIISRLSRSLEESQKQCASLLQTGLVSETNQLRLQLQQAQSAQLVSNEMNKALQEELKELKEEVALYESAKKHGVPLNDPGGGLEAEMTDSYVDLGIKKANRKTGPHSSVVDQEGGRGFCKDEVVLELKKEMERLLSSNRAKRSRVSQLQSELEDCRRTIDELKQQLVKMSTKELKGKSVELLSDTLQSEASEETLRLKENESLQQEIKSHEARIWELTENQEKLKQANQDLCSQMRQMVQEADRDKQEALDRCERTYRQHYEEVKKKLLEELVEKHSKEREKLITAYEENIVQLKADLEELNKEMMAAKDCYVSICREREEQEATLKAAFEEERRLQEEKFKKQSLEEKDEALKKLRAELEEGYRRSLADAQSRWQGEKEADMKQHAESEVAKANASWEKELKEAKARAVQEVEQEWQNRLDRALEEARRAAVELQDSGCQTEALSLKDDFLRRLVAEAVEEQTGRLREALEEKDKALRKHEARHHDTIASQVESALTKARARWLQELTELEEFKAHLKAAKSKWEEESGMGATKQVSLALSAAEEKWKKETENGEKMRARAKELEERTFSLKRELALKQDEIPALVKAELAKARAQWHKEKQEEVLRIQEQNERDYHAFLRDHRSKVAEALTKAKEDFAKQKEELLGQKEAELRRGQQEWAAQEARRLRGEIGRHEDRILAQVELLLDDTHRDLVRFAGDPQGWPPFEWKSPSPVPMGLPFKEKLSLSLRKAYKSTVYAILEKAREMWKEGEDSHLQSGEGETGDNSRPFLYDVGRQVDLERRLRKPPALQEADVDPEPRRAARWPQEGGCCGRCRPQLERKEKECQDLKKKLDKACRHLQLAVKEQRAKSEQLQENGKIEDSLTEENSSVKDRLDDLRYASVPPRSSSEGCILKLCPSCDGKALEEMRSQYIKAVGKIKSDMLRYIHESKERAAEIIKAEVFRERQETARKMRKYYLICLQQLLMDDGKQEGAEKKIISAASKIATMAKILETPVRNSSHTKASHSVPSETTKLFSEAEEPKGSRWLHPRQPPLDSQVCGESPGSKTGAPPAHPRRVPRSLQQQLDAESQPAPASQTQAGGRASKPPGGSPAPSVPVAAEGKASHGLPPASPSQNPPPPPPGVPQARLQELLPAGGAAGGHDWGPAGVLRFQTPSDKRDLGDLDRLQPAKQPPKPHGHEIPEMPVRDAGGGSSAEWTLPRDAVRCAGLKARSGVRVAPCEPSSAAGLFPPAEEDAPGFCWRPGGPPENPPGTRWPDARFKEGYGPPPATSLSGGVPNPNLDRLRPSDVRPFCSSSGKCHPLLQLRKPARDVADFHHDSGFDSPQLNAE